jgi:hypothetical protein
MPVACFRFLIVFLCSLSIVNAVFAQTAGDTITEKKSGKMVAVPGTSVRMIQPAHFLASAQIKGFVHAGSSATIQVNEVEGSPWTLVVKGVTKEYLESQGVTYIGEEMVKTNSGVEGKMYFVTFSVKSAKNPEEMIEYERILFFTGDYNKTIWINANFPVLVKGLLFDLLKESLLSVEF